jgi:excisionase family DNA binding protein
MLSQSPVMTAREVANLLRVNIKSVYEAVKKNAIPCRRMGRSVTEHGICCSRAQAI